ncbi:hypothetical protein B0H11DRAFT_1989648 [Mycena galericulata]|nr:hypothetical protein B0H11DRAFT_1989648 [Mycena galericulata]
MEEDDEEGTVDLNDMEEYNPADNEDEVTGPLPSDFYPFPSAESASSSDFQPGRRDQCKLSWNPFAMLRDCIFLPIKTFVESFITKIIDALASFDIAAIYEFFKTVVTIVAAILSEKGYTPSGEVTFDTNVSHPMTNTDAFGYAYYLASTGPIEYTPKGSDHSVSGELTAYCVGCRIGGFLKHRSKFRFTFSKGFVNAQVELVNGHLDFSTGLGLEFDLVLSGTLDEKNLVTIPLSPITIPGLIIVGPFATVDVGLGYEVGAKGKFLARNNIGWSNMKAKIDMINGANSFIGEWTPTPPVPILSLELEGSAKLGPFITAGLKFGVNILNGKLTVAAGLEIKASLPVGISAVVETGNTVDTQFQGCQGFNVTLEGEIEINVLLEAGPLKKPYNITPPFELPIFNKCIKLVEAERIDGLVPDVPPPMFLAANPDQVNRFITANFPNGSLEVRWFPKPDNNIYAVPPLEAYDAKYVLNRCFQGSTDVSITNATAGTYDNRVFIFNFKTMNQFGVAPLRVAPGNKVPVQSNVVALRSETGTDGKPFVGAVTTASKGFKPYYYPIICIYADRNKPAILWLAKDPEAGAKFLGRGQYATCHFAAFSIT